MGELLFYTGGLGSCMLLLCALLKAICSDKRNFVETIQYADVEAVWVAFIGEHAYAKIIDLKKEVQNGK